MTSVNMDNNVLSETPKKNRYATVKKKKLLFFFLMAMPFIIEVAVFYIYVNLSSFTMAFLEYELIPFKGDVSHFVWFKNFAYVINKVLSPTEVSMIAYSFIAYAFVLLIVTPIVIVFSFYIYKRFFLSGFFRVILFMPQIISSVLYVALYKTLLGPVKLLGMDVIQNSDPMVTLIALIAFVFWTGFGTNILLMSGAMASIDDSIVEACYLDGCNMTKEFIYVTLPSIYPTITTFIVLDLTSIFGNTMNLYTFFADAAPIKTVGYFIEINTIMSRGLVRPATDPYLAYPELSALGLMITLIVTPVTLTVRKVLEKVGPSED